MICSLETIIFEVVCSQIVFWHIQKVIDKKSQNFSTIKYFNIFLSFVNVGSPLEFNLNKLKTIRNKSIWNNYWKINDFNPTMTQTLRQNPSKTIQQPNAKQNQHPTQTDIDKFLLPKDNINYFPSVEVRPQPLSTFSNKELGMSSFWVRSEKMIFEFFSFLNVFDI